MKRKNMKKITLALIMALFSFSMAFSTPVPDTGQTKCYNATVEIPCPSPGQPFYGQDGNYSINPMSYTKLDGSGNDLPDSATSWVMVRDNVTGLIWEMKNNKDGVKNYNDPHDADNTYTWYDSNPATNGGNVGYQGNGTDTEDFIKALNDAYYGGFSDWRLPTFKELAYIVNYSIPYPGPTINTGYFPNTVASWWYWSSTTYADYTARAWNVDFGYGNDGWGDKNGDLCVRAVRGGQSGSFGNLVIGSFDTLGSEAMDVALNAAGVYTDNGDSTVTDTSTGLMWQQSSYDDSRKTWEQALAYCEELNLGGHTDWRMPTIKELRSLVDYSIPYPGPTINTTYFPGMVASLWYWSSTTYAYSTKSAWGVDFDNGGDSSTSKNYSSYVRAVRGGHAVVPTPPILSVSPANQYVTKDEGGTIFNVTNAGAGTMYWSAEVTSGSDWFYIPPGTSGTNAGTINCSYLANTTTSSRTATIRITGSPGTTGSPVDVTVTQAPAPVVTTACTATLDANLLLHIPYLCYADGNMTFWADLAYEYIPTYPISIYFYLAGAGVITNPSYSCTASTIASDLSIHIPDLLLPDGTTHLWLDFVYGNGYFLVSNYGFLPN